jgi:hypothetical protein
MEAGSVWTAPRSEKALSSSLRRIDWNPTILTGSMRSGSSLTS